MASSSQPVLDDLWARLLEAPSGQLAPAVFDSWLRPCRLLAVEGDHLRIGAPNPFARGWLMQYYLHAVQGAAEKCLGGHPQVSIVVDNAATTGWDQPASTTPATSPAGTTNGLIPAATFTTSSSASPTSSARPRTLPSAEFRRSASTPRSSSAGAV